VLESYFEKPTKSRVAKYIFLVAIHMMHYLHISYILGEYLPHLYHIDMDFITGWIMTT
jgi:hypothetical protein